VLVLPRAWRDYAKFATNWSSKENAMSAAVTALLVAALSPVLAVAQTQATKTLDIYVVDVEGGTAILFVSPTGE